MGATRFPIATFSDYAPHLEKAGRIRRDLKAARQAGDDAREKHARDDIAAYRKGLVRQGQGWFVETLLRWTWTETPLRERLSLFWFDHFTARGKTGILAPAGFPYIEEAIRPNMSGRFADLLIAAVTHPLMLHFLDQSESKGPNSKAARKGRRMTGPNENLAREVLELHTLGVGGPYEQRDVRQLAELFTGLSHDGTGRFVFRKRFAEPGAETVLGRDYGGGDPGLGPVLDALRDIAVHPATAHHIARKLAVHFVSDSPDPALVAHVSARFSESGGDLSRVYAALMEHPASWTEQTGNVKPPFDLVASACRALGVGDGQMRDLTPRDIRRALLRPLQQMGQPLLSPDGPDGWPEADTAWITPQGLSARLRWAMSAPAILCSDLPEPATFVGTALGEETTEPVRFAARAAESRSDAIGLILASPAFQRR